MAKVDMQQYLNQVGHALLSLPRQGVDRWQIGQVVGQVRAEPTQKFPNGKAAVKDIAHKLLQLPRGTAINRWDVENL